MQLRAHGLGQMPSMPRVAQLTRQRADATAVNRPGPADEPVFDPDLWTDPNQPPADVTLALRQQGAVRTGGRGQTGTGSAPAGQPDYPVDEALHHSNMNAAVGAALTRMGNGLMPAPDMTASRAARRRMQLEHLGITSFEIDLLSRTGGV